MTNRKHPILALGAALAFLLLLPHYASRRDQQ
jgi:hypothetical protein